MGDGRVKIETTADVSSPEVIGGSDIGVRLTIKNLGEIPVRNLRVEPVMNNELELRMPAPPIEILGVGQQPSVELTPAHSKTMALHACHPQGRLQRDDRRRDGVGRECIADADDAPAGQADASG